MPKIIVSNKPVQGLNGQIGTEGQIHWLRHGVDTFTPSELHDIVLPAGTQGLMRRPNWEEYNFGGRSRFYGTAAWTANILIDEHLRGLRATIPAPTIVPTVTAVAGPGVTVQSRCYLRFLDYRGQRKGRLSAGVDVALANQQRQWTLLPTTSVDPSVSHIQGLVGDDGALPRVAWTRQLGAVTVTEALATGALGEAHSTDFVEIPLCSMHVPYHDRLAYSGHRDFPERVYLTDEGEMERFTGLLVQTSGEAVRGLFVQNDTLFYGSSTTIYRAQGYNPSDFTREIEKPDIGLICHQGTVNILKRTIVPATKGPQLFDGNWHPLGGDRQKEWVRELKNFRSDYEHAHGRYDPVTGVYRFGPVHHSQIGGGDVWTFWVLDGERLFPEIESGQFSANWANDRRFREDATSCVWTLPGGGEAKFVTGSKDGNLRLENVESNIDDDGDSDLKVMVVVPPPIGPDPGGGPYDGFTFQKAWNHIKHNVDPVNQIVATMQFRAGTENCHRRFDPDDEDTVAGTFLQEDGAEVEAPTRQHSILESCTGKYLAERISIPNADAGRDNSGGTKTAWRGWGGTYSPGIESLGFVTEESGG